MKNKPNLRIIEVSLTYKLFSKKGYEVSRILKNNQVGMPVQIRLFE